MPNQESGQIPDKQRGVNLARVTPPAPEVPPVVMPPAWTSYSWWLGLVPVISGVIGFFLHKQIDLSPIAGAIALVGSSVAAGLIALARAMRHHDALQAETARISMRQEAHRQWLAYQHVPDTYASHQAVSQAFDQIHKDLDWLGERVDALTPKPPAAKKSTAARKTATGRG